MKTTIEAEDGDEVVYVFTFPSGYRVHHYFYKYDQKTLKRMKARHPNASELWIKKDQ